MGTTIDTRLQRVGRYQVRTEWWTDHTNLCALYRWLRDRDEAPDVCEFLEKPWHWTPEWFAMHGLAPVNDVEAST